MSAGCQSPALLFRCMILLMATHIKHVISLSQAEYRAQLKILPVISCTIDFLY